MASSVFKVASSAVDKVEESSKTKLAWYKLCGHGGAGKSVDEAVILLEESAKAGDGEAMWMLGLCKEYGMGTKQDIEGSEKLYRQSRKSGNEIGRFLESKKGCGRGKGRMMTINRL